MLRGSEVAAEIVLETERANQALNASCPPTPDPLVQEVADMIEASVGRTIDEPADFSDLATRIIATVREHEANKLLTLAGVR